jgi:hypothetical protein
MLFIISCSPQGWSRGTTDWLHQHRQLYSLRCFLSVEAMDNKNSFSTALFGCKVRKDKLCYWKPLRESWTCQLEVKCLWKDWLALYVSLGDSMNFILQTHYKDICITIYRKLEPFVYNRLIRIDKMLIILITIVVIHVVSKLFDFTILTGS